MDVLQDLQEELELLQKQCDKVNRQKQTKKLEKVQADDKTEELQKQLDALLEKKKSLQEDMNKQKLVFEDELMMLQNKHSELKKEETELQQKLSETEKAYKTIQDNLTISANLPEKNMNFSGCAPSTENKSAEEPMDISYTCNIVAGRPCILQGGQALLTFEKEQVAKSIISKKKHFLDIDKEKVSAQALQPSLHKSVKFELKMNISNKKLKISNLPADISEDILKDKVELAFYKSGIGGAEIEEVNYNRNNNTACVTYLQNGVAQKVLRNDCHQIMAGEATYEVKVEPCVDIELNKLQMFSAVSARSVLLTGIKNVDDQEEDDIQDVIQIHFQKESNGGGEVENILFCQNREIVPIFEQDII